MKQTLEQALAHEVVAALDAFEHELARDRQTAPGLLLAVWRARDAAERLLEMLPSPKRTSASRKPRARAATKNGGKRVPVAERRKAVLEILRDEARPVPTSELAEKLQTTPQVVRTIVKTIDADLLSVAKERGKEARYALSPGAETKVFA